MRMMGRRTAQLACTFFGVSWFACFGFSKLLRASHEPRIFCTRSPTASDILCFLPHLLASCFPIYVCMYVGTCEGCVWILLSRGCREKQPKHKNATVPCLVCIATLRRQGRRRKIHMRCLFANRPCSSYKALKMDRLEESIASFMVRMTSCAMTSTMAYSPDANAAFASGCKRPMSWHLQYSMITYCRCCPAMLRAFFVSSVSPRRDALPDRVTADTVGSQIVVSRRAYAAA